MMIWLFHTLAVTLGLLVSTPAVAAVKAENALSEGLPLRFEPTSDPDFLYQSMGNDFTALFRPDGIEFHFVDRALPPPPARHAHRRDALYRHTPSYSPVVRMQLVGGDAGAELKAEDPLPGKSNYYLGSDPRRWRLGIPHYARLRYVEPYRGIDLVF